MSRFPLVRGSPACYSDLQVLGDLLPGNPERHLSRHMRAHAWYAFYDSPFNTAAIIAVDGTGAWNFYYADRKAPDLIDKHFLNANIGRWYEAIAEVCSCVLQWHFWASRGGRQGGGGAPLAMSRKSFLF